MENPTFIGLINNTALLLALGVMYGFLQRRAETIGLKLLSGCILGVITVGLMLNPWQLAPGVIFDTRTILLSVGGLFLGFVSMIPALIISSAYRAYVGGAGILTGILWILGSGVIGVIWARIRKQPVYQYSVTEFYLFGVIVHLVMLLLMLTMPEGMWPAILARISLPVLLIFPFGTVLLGKLLANQELQQRNKLNLDASERKYRELVDNSQAIILRVGVDGRVTFFNQYAQGFFGYRKDEIIGQRLVDTIIPDDATSMHDLDLMFILSGQGTADSTAHESENICRDGRRVKIIWKNSPVYDEAGEIVGFQSVGHDLTDQRKAEDSLKKSEQQFHQLIDVSPVPLAILNDNHDFIYLNRRFSEMFGYTLDDLPTIADWWGQAYPEPHYREEVQLKWMDAANRTITHNCEFPPQEARVTCKNGNVLDVVATLASIGGQEIVVLNDMTQERQLARVKSEFIATAAHELNTPLTSAMGFAELLINNDHFDRETQKEYLAIIFDKTEILKKIISDLLELSRSESGRKIHLEKEPCNLSVQLQRIVNSYKIEFSERRFQVDWSESGSNQIYCDRVLIGQVLENLLSNALKFSPADTPINVTGKKLDNEVRVSVNNQGDAMTPEQCALAFERFYRVNASSTAVGGLGLGLSIAKGIVEAHDGSIDIVSNSEDGTTVSFTLPRTG